MRFSADEPPTTLEWASGLGVVMAILSVEYVDLLAAHRSGALRHRGLFDRRRAAELLAHHDLQHDVARIAGAGALLFDKVDDVGGEVVLLRHLVGAAVPVWQVEHFPSSLFA